MLDEVTLLREPKMIFTTRGKSTSLVCILGLAVLVLYALYKKDFGQEGWKTDRNSNIRIGKLMS